MKYTSKQRDIIKDIVLTNFIHPTAEDVYKMMINQNINTSISTVYRNLHQLSEEGVILELTMPSGKIHYDGNTYTHQHAICTKCQKIFDVEFNDDSIRYLVKDQIGLDMSSYQITIKGLCKDCNK